jgi:CRISPR-associated protein Cas5t
VKAHAKGTDAYLREFHVSPKLILWIDRLDWKEYFLNPVGTPALGRSQDLLKIEKVEQVAVTQVEETILSGCMLPFNSSLKIGGQLVQLAEAYEENEEVGSGRSAKKSSVFMAVPYDNKSKLKYPNLYQIRGNNETGFYLHSFQ